MYNIPVPACSPRRDYDYVAASRRAKTTAVLNALRPCVSAAYGAYQAARGNTSAITPLRLTPAETKILKGNFDRLDKDKPCSSIRSDLLATTESGQCPYCRLEEATTLDHILEKVKYPEFSVLRFNLAPCCPRCNTTKQNNAKKVAGAPNFHLYYAGYPLDPFLTVRIVIAPPMVTFEFSLTRPSSLPPAAYAALQGHFDSLELAGRYRRRARTEMQDLKYEMQRLHGVGGRDTVKTFLARLAVSAARNWSAQDWRHVLLASAAADIDFCDHGIFLL